MPQDARLWAYALALTLIGGALAGCVQPKPYPIQGAYRYQCEGGKTFQVTVAPDQNSAVVKFDEQEWTMKRTISASGATFTDGGKVLWMKGNQALIESDSEVLFRKCTSVSSPR
ncbi:MAG: MliC family protein [Nitrospirota bacterium]